MKQLQFVPSLKDHKKKNLYQYILKVGIDNKVEDTITAAGTFVHFRKALKRLMVKRRNQGANAHPVTTANLFLLHSEKPLTGKTSPLTLFSFLCILLTFLF